MNDALPLPFLAPLAILYCRVSSEMQVTNTSLDFQEAELRQRALHDGCEIDQVFREEGGSGAFFLGRGALQAALLRIDSLRRQYPQRLLRLYITKVDRAARDVAVFAQLKHQLMRLGAQMLYTDGTPSGEGASESFTQEILAAAAGFERRRMAERCRDGKRATAQKGIMPARTVRCFGYLFIRHADVYPGSPWSPADIGKIVLHPDEYQHARNVWTWLLSGSWSARGIVAELERLGIPTVRGGRWEAGRVADMIANPIYKGMARYGFQRHTLFERPDGTKGRISRRLSDEETVFIPCPALVTPQEWDAGQEILASNRRIWGGNPKRRHLLTGLLRCPVCGYGMSAFSADGHRYVECSRSRGIRKECLSRQRWRADLLEHLVLETLGELAQRPGTLTAVAAHEATQERPSVDIGALRRAVVEAQRALDVAGEVVVEARLSGEDTAPYRAAVQKRAETLRAAQAALERAQDAPEKARDVNLAALARAAAAIYEELSHPAHDVQKRADALRLLVRKIVPFFDGERPYARRMAPHGALISLTFPDSVGLMVV